MRYYDYILLTSIFCVLGFFYMLYSHLSNLRENRNAVCIEVFHGTHYDMRSWECIINDTTHVSEFKVDSVIDMRVR
jgi:hypothetical protein